MPMCARCNAELPSQNHGELCPRCADPQATFDFGAGMRTQPVAAAVRAEGDNTAQTIAIPAPPPAAADSKQPTAGAGVAATIDIGRGDVTVNSLPGGATPTLAAGQATLDPGAPTLVGDAAARQRGAPTLAQPVDVTVEHGWGTVPENAGGIHTSIKGEREHAVRRAASRRTTTQSLTDLNIRPHRVRETLNSAPTAAEFEKLELLGQGGMGKVFAARQTSIDRTIALKVLRAEYANRDDHRAKFLAEAVVTGELEHPNIVPIYDVGATEQGELFYAMKRVRGTPWSHVLTAKSRTENLGILLSVADAVAYAHSRGIVHRDLKPENVMLGDYGEVLVMDWGLALAQPDCEKANLTSPFATLGGTPSYMPPEMATGPLEAIGPAADIYLLGAILFEIVTGKQPHQGATVLTCLHAAARNEIVACEEQGELVDIAMRAMASQPAERYADVRSFQQAIRTYQSHSESVLLAAQAARDLEKAKDTSQYADFARALFAFQEAQALWSDNVAAAEGESKTRLAYANCALGKGDFDLGLSLLSPTDPLQQPLYDKLQAARTEREEKQRRLRNLRTAIIALAALIFIIVSGSLFWIGRQHMALNTAFTTIQDRNEKLAEARQQAVDEAAQARKAERAEAYASYLAQIGTAADRIESNAFRDAQRILQRYAGARGDAFRGWEWGYLARLCQLDSGTESLPGRGEALALSGDGEHMAAMTSLGETFVWQFNREKQNWSVVARWHTPNAAPAIAISRQGTAVILGTTAGELLTFTRDMQQSSFTLGTRSQVHRGAITSLHFAPNDTWLASTSADETAAVVDYPSLKVANRFRGHFGAVATAAFAPDNSRLVTGGSDGTVRVWPTQGNEAPLVYRGHRDAVFAVAVSPDGNWIASAGRDREIQLWQPRDLREFDFAKLEQQLELVRAGRPQASDERYHTPARRLLGHEGEVATLAFSRDGKVLLSGGHDNTVRRWLLELKENDPQAVKVLRGHGGWVKGVVSLAGGEWAASVGHDEQLKRWQLDTYQEVETLRGHDDAVLQASFSADGSRLVTASRDRRVLLWDTARGAQLKELIEHTDTPAQGSGPIADLREGHEFLLSSATFFPGEPALLATAAGDNSVRVWDVVAGAQVKLLPGTGTVSVTAISPSGTWLLTGSESTSVLLWNMQHAGKPISLAGHQHEISAATFAHGSDDLLVTGDIRGRVFLWRRDSQRNEWSIAHDLVGHLKGYTITGVRFSPDDSRVYVASRDQTVMQWDTKTGLLLSERTWKHTDAVKSFDLAPHGNQALTLCATAEGNYRAYLWDTASNSSRHCDLPVDGVATGIAFDSQGQQAWIAVNTAETSSVWQWDLQASQAQQLWPNLPLRGTIWSLLPARDPQQVLAIGGNNARLLDLATGRLITPFRPHNAVHAARFSPNGKEIVSTGADGDVKIWNADDTSPAFGRVRIKITRAHDLNDRPQPVNDAAFLPDGEQVVTAGDDHTVKLWRLADTSATLVQTFQGHTQRVLSVSLSSSGEKLVTASADGTARVWSLGPLKNEAARTVAELVLPHPSPVYAATISPDGRFVATGAADHLARVWDLDHPNKPLWELAGHTAGVTSTSISPDAARLVTGSEDGMLKLWDLATGNQVLGLKRHSAEISSVQFSPDGQNLLSSSADRTSLLFRALSLPRATAP